MGDMGNGIVAGQDGSPGRPEASCAQRGEPSRTCESFLKAGHEDMLRAAASHHLASGVRRARATVTAIPHPAIIWAVAAETVLTPCSRRVHPGHGGRQRCGRPSFGPARPRQPVGGRRRPQRAPPGTGLACPASQARAGGCLAARHHPGGRARAHDRADIGVVSGCRPARARGKQPARPGLPRPQSRAPLTRIVDAQAVGRAGGGRRL
jgi:hypothetical protein